MEQIRIQDLEVFGHHGVFKEEVLLGQKFLVSAVIDADLSEAVRNDDLLKGADYGEICRLIVDFITKKSFQLIETMASNLADEILLRFEKVHAVELEIKKPWAPVGYSMQYVSVKTKRAWHTAYIAVGSNMGDKENNINDAIALIESDIKCKVGKVSDFVTTKTVGPIEQDDFLNVCMELQTIYTPQELLAYLQTIEDQAKRDRKIHDGPRTLDLDILFYDDVVMSEPNLIIPHPYMNKRMYVLEPMCQIAPYYVHPLLQTRIHVLKDKIAKEQRDLGEM